MTDPVDRLDGDVQLVVPADPRLLRLVRLVASGVASLAGCDLDTTEEVRVAADELVAALMAAGAGSPVSVSLGLTDRLLVIDARTEVGGGAGLEVDPLTDRILAAVSTEHRWEQADGQARGVVERRLP